MVSPSHIINARNRRPMSKNQVSTLHYDNSVHHNILPIRSQQILLLRTQPNTHRSIRRLPYYYLGYIMAQTQILRRIQRWRDLLGCVICFLTSLFLFEWHLHEENLFIHIALFYPINIGFLFGVLYCCKLLNQFKSDIIINLSVGTLVIIGIHTVIISIINYIFERLLWQNTDICYHWYEAILVSLSIVALLYPIILWGKKHLTILLGR